MPNVAVVNHFGGIEEIKRAAVYIRVSSNRKRQPRSLDNQSGGLISYVDSSYNLKLEGVYADIGSGRSADTRKELKRLIQDCMDGKIDYIVTKSVSRFGRDTAGTLSLCRKLKEKNINVYFLNENINSLDENGELSLTLHAAVAEGDSCNKSESIKWGIEKSAEDETSAIYSRRCYGYKPDGRGGLAIVKSEAEVVRRIFDSYLSGMGTHAIKVSLEKDKIPSPTNKEKWSKRTIEKMLVNEKYCGDVIIYKTYMAEYPSTKRVVNTGEHEKKIYKDHHKPIIDRETFDKVQKMIEDRSRR